MKELFTAIYAQHVGTSFSGMIDDLFAYVAPESAVEPFAVFQIVSGVPDHTFNTEFEEILVEFRLYSVDEGSPVEINNLFDALKNVYDNCSLSIDGYTHVYMEREGYIPIRDIEEGVYQYNVQYRILMEKN